LEFFEQGFGPGASLLSVLHQAEGGRARLFQLLRALFHQLLQVEAVLLQLPRRDTLLLGAKEHASAGTEKSQGMCNDGNSRRGFN
jgi:hypothetical protein